MSTTIIEGEGGNLVVEHLDSGSIKVLAKSGGSILSESGSNRLAVLLMGGDAALAEYDADPTEMDAQIAEARQQYQSQDEDPAGGADETVPDAFDWANATQAELEDHGFPADFNQDAWNEGERRDFVAADADQRLLIFKEREQLPMSTSENVGSNTPDIAGTPGVTINSDDMPGNTGIEGGNTGPSDEERID